MQESLRTTLSSPLRIVRAKIESAGPTEIQISTRKLRRDPHHVITNPAVGAGTQPTDPPRTCRTGSQQPQLGGAGRPGPRGSAAGPGLPIRVARPMIMISGISLQVLIPKITTNIKCILKPVYYILCQIGHLPRLRPLRVSLLPGHVPFIWARTR